MLTQLMIFHSLNLVRTKDMQDFKYIKFHNSMFMNMYRVSGTVLDTGCDRAAVLNEQRVYWKILFPSNY